jgi:SAM-dependent methyltransferase
MDLRKTFNEDVVNYDKWRPNYCPALFDLIIQKAQISVGKTALEIGCGTGQATGPILKTGCQVTAVELGEDLAAYTVEKYKQWKSFKVVQGEFEQFQGEPNSMDLVFSATAFHWIPEDIGYPKVYDLLKTDGTLALFWNHPHANSDEDALHVDLQKVYDEFRSVGKFKEVKQNPNEETEQSTLILQTIEKYGFVQAQCYLFYSTRSFSPSEYVALLETYSDHRSMPESEKGRFYDKIKQTIEQHGGIMKIYDTMDLYLAKKPISPGTV